MSNLPMLANRPRRTQITTVAEIEAQLPRTLVGKLHIVVAYDTFGLRVRAMFTSSLTVAFSKNWECTLEKPPGSDKPWRVPAEFLARLCVEVR